MTKPPEDTKSRELRRIFGANVRRFRQEQRYSQREIAAIAGVSQKHIAKIETTGASAGLDVVEDIARALGKTPAQMLTRLRTPRDD